MLKSVVANYKPGTEFQERTIARLQETNVGLKKGNETLQESHQQDILQCQAEKDASADLTAALTQERNSLLANQTRNQTLSSAAENEVEDLKRKLDKRDTKTELLKVRLRTFERYLPEWKDPPE